MENMNYEKTFEVMQAYASLPVLERKIIEFLFKLDVYEGNYSQLARELKMDVSNCTNIVKYLNALGIVFIGHKKGEDKITEVNGKERASVNKMTYCFLVYGWWDNLVKHYNNGNICTDMKQKVKFVIETRKKFIEMTKKEEN